MSNLGTGISIVISFVALSVAILAFQSSPPRVVQTPPESDVGPIGPQNQLVELSDQIATLDMKVSEQLSEIEQLKLLIDARLSRTSSRLLDIVRQQFRFYPESFLREIDNN